MGFLEGDAASHGPIRRVRAPIEIDHPFRFLADSNLEIKKTAQPDSSEE